MSSQLTADQAQAIADKNQLVHWKLEPIFRAIREECRKGRYDYIYNEWVEENFILKLEYTEYLKSMGYRVTYTNMGCFYIQWGHVE